MTDALIVFEEDPIAWINALSKSMHNCTLESIKKLGQAQVTTIVPPSTVKKRGRPLKIKPGEEESFAKPQIVQIEAPIEQVAPPSTARKRGRPPKNAIQPKVQSQSSIEVTPKSSNPPPSTRKRGRPVRQVKELSEPSGPVDVTLGEVMEDAYNRRLSKKFKPEELMAPPETPVRREIIQPAIPSTRRRKNNLTVKTPSSIPKSTFIQTNIAAKLPQSTTKRISTDAWVTVSQEATTIAPSVLATPLPSKQQASTASPLEKVDSWTSKFLKPAPPPPSTIKRSARIAAKFKNVQVEESPLTRAKRLDTEFIKREAFFKNFVEGSSDALKQKLLSIGKSSDTNPSLTNQAEVSSLECGNKKSENPVKSPMIYTQIEVAVPLPQRETTPLIEKPIFKSPAAPIESADIMKETPLVVEMNEHEEELFSGTNTAAIQPIVKKPVIDEAASLRIKERQNKAVEKKKQQLEKAMLAKQPPQIKQPISQQKPVIPLSRNPSDLYHAAILNSAAKKQLQQTLAPTTTTTALPYKTPITKEAAKAVGTPESLPEIPDSEEENNAKKTNNANVPYWARTPALNAALFNQKLVRPEDIFGQVQPIKLEDFFKDRNFKSASPGWKK